MKVKLENKRKGVLRVIVNIWIPELSEYAKSVAIFDTGAYKTIIDERIARLLKLPIESKKSVTITASDEIMTHNCTLPRISLGTKVIRNVPVTVMKLPEKLETRCILGMNVLQEFDITISNYNESITLIPKPLPLSCFVENYSISLTSVEDDISPLND